jgi:hypothetical protein
MVGEHDGDPPLRTLLSRLRLSGEAQDYNSPVGFLSLRITIIRLG